MMNKNKEQILDILERIAKIEHEMDKIKNELNFMLRDNEKEKFATNRKINSLPDELQDNPENIIAVHHFLSVERKLNNTMDIYSLLMKISIR